LLSGRRITGVEAAEWGLANALAGVPRQALQFTKARLRSDEGTVGGRMAEELARRAR
jgi:enoyl-CoA hydratase/carnithine racemase